MSDKAPMRSLIMVLLAGVFWSLQGLSIRMIEQAASEQIIFWRSVSQGVVLFTVIAVINRGRVLQGFRAAGKASVLGGLCMLVASTGFVFALGHTTVANVVFFLACSPLVAALISWVVMRERISRRTLGAMLVAACGIGMMTSESQITGQFLGNLFSFFTMLGFAGMAVIARWGGGIRMLPAICWGALFTLIVSYSLAGGDTIISLRDTGLCFISGGVLTAAGATLFMFGARYIAAGLLAFLTLTEVVLAPIWVWIGFGEVPSDYTLIGGGIVLSAIIAEATLRVIKTSRRIRPQQRPGGR